MIRSFGVAELAAKQLGMLEGITEPGPAADAALAKFNWRDWLPEALRTPARTPTADEIRANRISGLRGAIQVNPIQGSQLVDVTMYHTNPQVAADRVNAVTEAYIGFLNDTKFESLRIDQSWYTSRLDSARDDLDQANQELQDFYERQGLLRGGTNEGGASLQQRNPHGFEEAR